MISEKRAADIDRSHAWWERFRAIGRCAVCREPFQSEHLYHVHTICSRLLYRRYSYAEIRAMSHVEREMRSTTRENQSGN